MSEVIRTKHIDIFGNKHVCVKASDYDKLAGEHAELISGMKENMAEVIEDLHAELWRAKEERDSQQRIAIAAMTELAELKAKCGSVFPEYKPLPELMMASYHEVKGWNACLDEATRLRTAIVAALQAECKGLENEVNKLERNLAAAPSREGEV